MSTLFNNFGWYDLLLMTVVSGMAVGVAYLKSPRWKAFLSLLPLPSTLAALSLDQPIDVSFLLGLLMTLFFYGLVYLLHHRIGANIVLAIAISAVGYCLLGMLVLPFLPASRSVFLLVFAGLMVIGAIVNHGLAKSEENECRTRLPAYIKAPIVMGVVFLLVNLKHVLSGFMAGFPMVGVVGAYEMRRCPMALFSQVPLTFFATGSLMAVCFLTQSRIGLHGGLLLGWAVYLLVLLCLWKKLAFAPATKRVDTCPGVNLNRKEQEN